MAAPTVRGYTFGSSNQGTTCDVSAPTPMNVGNTLVMLIGASNNPTITMPSGWNRVASNTGTVRLETWTKAVVSADIGRSIRITMSGQQAIVGVCFVINNNDWSWDGSGYSPSDPVRTAATNTSSTPNPPNVPYGFSGRSNVVLCDYVVGNGGSSTPPGHTGFPGNTPDSNYQASTYNSAPDGVRHGWASIERSGGSSWDPDTFGISRSALWRAATMVFRDQRAPTPDFTVDEVPGQPNQRTFTVIRNVGDPDVDSWNWDFGTGDGGGGTTQTYAFPGPGTYTVVLTATNSDSAKNSAQDVVIPATGAGISLDGESDGSSPSSATLGLVVQIAGSSAGSTTNYGDIGRRRPLSGQSDSGATVYDAAMGGGSTGLPPLHDMSWAYYLDLDSGDVYSQDIDGVYWKQGTIPGTGGSGGGGTSFGTPALGLGTANTPGVATTAIRTDAGVAVFDATAPVTQAFGDAAAVGAAAVAARRDHKHGMPAAPAAERAAASTTPAAIGTAAVGTGTTDARADHVHATGAGVPTTAAYSDAAATGAGPAAAMSDHRHGMPAAGGATYAVPAVVLGTAGAAGAAGTGIRSDSTIAAFDATVPVTQAFGDAAATGAAAFAARRDHKHGMPAGGAERAAATTTPAAVGTAAVGTGTTDARADHVHATGAGVPSTQAFGDAAATGAGPAAAMTDHKHAMPADPTAGPGTIVMYGGAAAPTGWLLCDGSSLLRAGTYANLFAIIGTTFGSVDGTHFTLPDLRQRFPMGKAAAGTGNVLGVTGGAIDHAHSNGVHTHPITAQVTGQQSTGDDTITTSAGSNNSSKRIHTHSLTGNVDIGTASNTGATNPPFIALNFVIKY